MAWIEAPHEGEWGDEFAELRDEVIDPIHGRVDWILRVHALDAGSMKAHQVLYRQAMRSTATRRKVEREMIAIVVSKVNDCHSMPTASLTAWASRSRLGSPTSSPNTGRATARRSS